MNNNTKQLIAFADASGNFDQKDKFFGVGMLMIENPGPLTDKLHLIFQRVFALSQSLRDKKIESLKNEGKYEEIIKMLKKVKRFELKYDRISPIKFDYYKEMIKIFLDNSQCRFSCMVIDRHSPTYNDSFFANMWEAYTSYTATLITPELINLSDCKVFLVLDEVPRPKVAQYSLEETILDKINKRINSKYAGRNLGKIINAIRIESHSNLLMQLNDVLLGCMMYEFKKRDGLVSQKLKNKKEEVVMEIRKAFGKDSLASTFTAHSPVYFNIWEANFNTTKNGESDKKPHPRFCGSGDNSQPDVIIPYNF